MYRKRQKVKIVSLSFVASSESVFFSSSFSLLPLVFQFLLLPLFFFFFFVFFFLLRLFCVADFLLYGVVLFCCLSRICYLLSLLKRGRGGRGEKGGGRGRKERGERGRGEGKG